MISNERAIEFCNRYGFDKDQRDIERAKQNIEDIEDAVDAAFGMLPYLADHNFNPSPWLSAYVGYRDAFVQALEKDDLHVWNRAILLNLQGMLLISRECQTGKTLAVNSPKLRLASAVAELGVASLTNVIDQTASARSAARNRK